MVCNLPGGFSQGSISSIPSTVPVAAMEVDRKPCPNGYLLRTEPHNVEWMQKFPLDVKKNERNMLVSHV